MTKPIPIRPPSLSETVAGLAFSEKDKLRLLAAASNLELPDDVKIKLVTLVRDTPPPEATTNISAALAANAINPGLAQESHVLKALRLGLWALVYFHGQVIQYHLFMRWATGQKIQEDSDIVALFRKNLRKLDRSVVRLGLRCVGLVKERKNSDPKSVDGFRLSRSGTDYTDKVAKQSKGKADRALRRFAEALDDERILAEDVEDPGMQAFVANEKDTVATLDSRGVFSHFSQQLPLLPPPDDTDKK